MPVATTVVAPPPPPPPAPPGPLRPRSRPAPTVEIASEDPLGGTTTVGARPRRPEDPTLCLALSGLPRTCLDAPLPPLPLPVLVLP